MKLGLFWAIVILVGAYIANDYIPDSAWEAAVVVGLAIWFIKEHT